MRTQLQVSESRSDNLGNLCSSSALRRKKRNIGARAFPFCRSHARTEQRTFAEAILSNERRTTRRERFLTDMDPMMPWATVEALVEPH